MMYYIAFGIMVYWTLISFYAYIFLKKEDAIIALIWVAILSVTLSSYEIKDKIDSVCGATKVEETVDDSTLYPFPQD